MIKKHLESPYYFIINSLSYYSTFPRLYMFVVAFFISSVLWTTVSHGTCSRFLFLTYAYWGRLCKVVFAGITHKSGQPRGSCDALEFVSVASRYCSHGCSDLCSLLETKVSKRTYWEVYSIGVYSPCLFILKSIVSSHHVPPQWADLLSHLPLSLSCLLSDLGECCFPGCSFSRVCKGQSA